MDEQNLESKILTEIDEQLVHLDALKMQVVQTDAGIQALRWVLRKMQEALPPPGVQRGPCTCELGCCLPKVEVVDAE